MRGSHLLARACGDVGRGGLLKACMRVPRGVGGVVFAPVLLFRVKVFGWICGLVACLGFVAGLLLW